MLRSYFTPVHFVCQGLDVNGRRCEAVRPMTSEQQQDWREGRYVYCEKHRPRNEP